MPSEERRFLRGRGRLWPRSELSGGRRQFARAALARCAGSATDLASPIPYHPSRGSYPPCPPDIPTPTTRAARWSLSHFLINGGASRPGVYAFGDQEAAGSNTECRVM